MSRSDPEGAPTLLVAFGAGVRVGRRIATASSAAHALRILARSTEIALVAVDLTAPDVVDLIASLVGRVPSTSLVVLADEDGRRGLGRDRAIVALVPRGASRLEMEERLRAAATLPAPAGVGLRTVLRVAAQRAETVTLHVETSGGRGYVRLARGAPCDASSAELRGPEALRALLDLDVTSVVAERETTADRQTIEAPLTEFLADDDEPLAELGEADLVAELDVAPADDDALPESLHLLGRISVLDGVLAASVVRWSDRAVVTAIGPPSRGLPSSDLWQRLRSFAADGDDELEEVTLTSSDEIEVLRRLDHEGARLLHLRFDRESSNVALVRAALAQLLG